MRRPFFALALVAVLALGACGGKSAEKTAATTLPPTTAAPVDTVARGSDQAGTPFCQLAKTYSDKSDAIAVSITDPVALKAAATDAEAAIRQAQAVAPAAVKSDVAKVAKTASEVLAGLKKSNYAFANTPELAKIQDPAFQSSLTKVTDYARAHCGVG